MQGFFEKKALKILGLETLVWLLTSSNKKSSQASKANNYYNQLYSIDAALIPGRNYLSNYLATRRTPT